VVACGGRSPRGGGLHGASAGRSSPWAIGEARGHCPLRSHTLMNGQLSRVVPSSVGGRCEVAHPPVSRGCGESRGSVRPVSARSVIQGRQWLATAGLAGCQCPGRSLFCGGAVPGCSAGLGDIGCPCVTPVHLRLKQTKTVCSLCVVCAWMASTRRGYAGVDVVPSSVETNTGGTT
jgi:hypothetical protein